MKKKIIGIFVCTLLIIATVIPATGKIKTETNSPLFAIVTYVDDITPYDVPSSPLVISATGPNDLDDVTLYYRWSSDNVSWTGMEEFSIFEDFESGVQNTSLWNTYQSGADARIQFDYPNAHGGNHACSMDDFDSQNWDYSLNVIYTKFDFSGANEINIDFWEREWGDEFLYEEESWTGWQPYDVVAFTNDGSTWYRLFSESQLSVQSYTNFQYNLSDHPDFSSPVSSDFSIAFQQYDNVQLVQDGRAWDDILIEYIFGAPSVNWDVWIHTSNPDTNYPWEWGFNFPEGTGYYEFYSIGKIYGQEVETPPSVADARCRYTHSPEVYGEYPASGSTDIIILPELEISVSDEDGDDMNLVWYSNSSGSWKPFETNIEVGDGTYSFKNSNFSEFDTTYYWYVSVSDNIFTIDSSIFYFTTEENLPPYTPNDPDPADGATDVSIQEILTWSGGDPNQGDKVYYDIYFGTSSSPPLVLEDTQQTAYDPGDMELETIYYWKIVSEDTQGETVEGPIWSFTTEAESNAPPTAPDIYGSPQGPPGKELCWLFVSRDFDEHQVKYIIDWGDGDTEETDYYAEGYAVEACHVFDELGEYEITIHAEDEKGLAGMEDTFIIKIQKPRSVIHSLLQRLFEQFPILEKILSLINIL